jgi:hypothetical protein
MRPARIAFLGDSHVSGLFGGWRLAKGEFPSVEATFFGCPAGTIAGARLEGHTLVARSSRLARYWGITAPGVPAFDTSNYDAVVIVGFGTSLFSHMTVQKLFVLAGSRKAGPKAQLVSEPAWLSAMTNSIASTRGLLASRKVVAIAGKPAFLIATPRPERRILESAKLAWAKKRVPDAGWVRLQSTFDSAVAQAAEATGLTVLPQPEETFDGPAFSRAEFSRGSYSIVRNSDSPAEDCIHMNAAFGAIVFRHHIPRILAAIGGTRSERVDVGPSVVSA